MLLDTNGSTCFLAFAGYMNPLEPVRGGVRIKYWEVLTINKHSFFTSGRFSSLSYLIIRDLRFKNNNKKPRKILSSSPKLRIR